MEYVQNLHAQKEMFSEFVKTIIKPAKEKPRMQPTTADIKAAVLRFPGPLVTYQAFKNSVHAASEVCKSKSMNSQRTPSMVLAMLQKSGCLAVPKKVFIQKPPTEILNWPVDAPCSREEYGQRF